MNSTLEDDNRTHSMVSAPAVTLIFLSLVSARPVSLSASSAEHFTVEFDSAAEWMTEAGTAIETVAGEGELATFEFLFDVQLDSPEFVPREVRDLEARGFERRNRWQ